MRTTALLCGALAACFSSSSQAAFDLQITEIYFGSQEDPDVTEDWFELTNLGDTAWVAATDGDLYFDDASADATTADLLSGIDYILPGQSVVFIDDADTAEFDAAWANVPGVRAGFYSGAGLGGGGDTINLWLGDPLLSAPFEVASYPDADALFALDLIEDGVTYDVFLGEFSAVGNAAGAVQSVGLGGGDDVLPRTVPAIGSPGSIPEPSATLLLVGALTGVGATRRNAGPSTPVARASRG